MLEQFEFNSTQPEQPCVSESGRSVLDKNRPLFCSLTVKFISNIECQKHDKSFRVCANNLI